MKKLLLGTALVAVGAYAVKKMMEEEYETIEDEPFNGEIIEENMHEMCEEGTEMVNGIMDDIKDFFSSLPKISVTINVEHKK